MPCPRPEKRESWGLRPFVPIATFKHMTSHKPVLKPHRLHVALSSEQFKALKALRKETGAPVAELLRRAISAYVQPKPKEAA